MSEILESNLVFAPHLALKTTEDGRHIFGSDIYLLPSWEEAVEA